MEMSNKASEMVFNGLDTGGLFVKVGDDKYLSFEQVKIVFFVFKSGGGFNNGPLELCERGWVFESDFFRWSDDVIVEGEKVFVGFE